MPPPFVRKPAPTEKPKHTELPSIEHTDSYGIVYLNGTASLKVAIDVKLSRNYQSAGVQAGMEFVTKAALADEALPKAFDKLRDSLKPQIAAASNLLNEV